MSTNPPPSRLHPTKTLILRFLEKNGPQTIRQVSEEIGVGYTHTGVLLRQLYDMGLLTESFAANKSYWRIRHATKGSAENDSIQGGEG
jgi:DNA-binding transcriptional ArsR family regulator